MSQFYKLHGVPGFEGMVVEGELRKDTTVGTVIEIQTVINPNVVQGDRLMRFPIPPRAFHVAAEFATECADPDKEFSTKNPFGKFLYEGQYVRDELHFAYGVFDNALSVTIYEVRGQNQKTLYSQNFFENRKMAAELIQEVLEGRMDPDDLVFNLKDVKEKEQKGAM